MSKIITISRSFSSGGREVAKRLADELLLSYYDHELIEEIAKETGFCEDYIEKYSESSASRAYSFHMARSFVATPPMPSETIQIAQSNIIRGLPARGDCVIVGRCADYILREFNPLKVFIYSSDMDKRIERCYDKVPEDRENKTPAQMKKLINSIDKKRAKYHNSFAEDTWGDMQAYNLCIDTSVISIKQAVQMIILAANEM